MIEIKRKNKQATAGIMKSFKKAAAMEIAVGFPAGKTFQPYTDEDGNSVPLLEVAASNCFGTDKIPQRDFMAYSKPDLQTRTKPILHAIAKLASTSTPTGKTVEGIQMLQEAAGQAGQAAIQQAIIDLKQPPNAKGTLHPSAGGTNPKGKKSTNPLIDTEHLKNSVTYDVREKK